MITKLAGLTWRLANRKPVVTLMDQGFVSIANFLSGVIIGQNCSKEQFGLYMLGLTLFVFASGIQGGLILTPFTVYSPRLTGKDYDTYLKSTFFHQLGFSLFVIVILSGLWVSISLGIGPTSLLPVLRILILVITFMLMKEYARSICFAALKVHFALLIDMVVSVFQVTGLLLLAHFNLLSASMAYWIIGAACITGAGGWVLSSRKIFTSKTNQTISHFIHNWSIGKWIIASTAVWTLSTGFYPWILASFHSTSAAGTWAACQGVIAMCNPLILGLQNYLGPKMAHTYSEGGRAALGRYSLLMTAVMILLMIPFCLTLCFLGDRLISMIYGELYAGNGLAVSILGFGMLCLVSSFCFSRTLFIVERAELDFMTNVFSLIVLLSAGIWMTKNFGVVGAAGALCLNNLGGLIVRYVLFYKVISFDAQKARPKAEKIEQQTVN